MSSDIPPQRPSPAPDGVSLPYWLAARDRVLVVQVCASCGACQYPPDLACHHCASADLHYEEDEGAGVVYSYAIYTRTFDAAFPAPYVLAFVELSHHPGVRIMANVVEVDASAVEVGMDVEVIFEPRGEWLVPQFRPVGVAAS